MAFTRAGKYPYRKGRIFLGKSVLFHRPIGIKTDRHLLTVAGSRTGKGAALIMPNLQRCGCRKAVETFGTCLQSFMPSVAVKSV